MGAFKCEVVNCGSSFTRGSDLRRHARSVHEGALYACVLCPCVCGTASNLARHVRNCHGHRGGGSHGGGPEGVLVPRGSPRAADHGGIVVSGGGSLAALVPRGPQPGEDQNGSDVHGGGPETALVPRGPQPMEVGGSEKVAPVLEPKASSSSAVPELDATLGDVGDQLAATVASHMTPRALAARAGVEWVCPHCPRAVFGENVALFIGHVYESHVRDYRAVWMDDSE